MSVSKIFLGVFSNTFYARPHFSSRRFVAFRPYSPTIYHSSSFRHAMPRKQPRGIGKEQRWVEKSKAKDLSASMSASGSSLNATTEAVTDRLNTLTVAEMPAPSAPSIEFGSVGLRNHVTGREQKVAWKPKSYGTVSGATEVGLDSAPVEQMRILGSGSQKASTETSTAVLSKLFSDRLLENFTIDNSTFSLAQVRATFYPKFENEKSDQEVRTRMIEMVSKGLATVEVSLKPSGSLFMYAGHEGGAYAKNSYGNMGPSHRSSPPLSQFPGSTC